MKYVGSVWPLFHKKILSAKRKLLILDFDGTLAKIAKTPHEVVLGNKTIKALTVLSGLSFYKLAVVSGRTLENLKSFFHIENAIYAGNHGLELKGGKLSLPEKARKAKKLEALVWLLGEKLREDLSNVPGILIEDKNYTLSIHYRNISREHYPFFKQEIKRFRKQYAHWPLIWRAGKKVWEVRPGVKWDKGELALYLTKKFPDALPIIVGDDDTDEDMFKALRHRGVTIRVGQSKKSSAEFYVNSSKEVRVFLERLADAKA
jgi:trehalose-phosphatase